MDDIKPRSSGYRPRPIVFNTGPAGQPKTPERMGPDAAPVPPEQLQSEPLPPKPYVAPRQEQSRRQQPERERNTYSLPRMSAPSVQRQDKRADNRKVDDFRSKPAPRALLSEHSEPKDTGIQKIGKKLGKKGILILIVLLIASIAAGVYFLVLKPKKNDISSSASENAGQQAQKQPKQLTGNFRILATGDIIPSDSVNNNAKQANGTYDYSGMLSEIKPILEKSPTRICHDTVPSGGAGMGITGYPNFNAPTELITSLANSGCNVMGLASDHINDKGQAGIDATIQAIQAQKSIVISSGANRSAEDQQKPQFFNAGDGAIKFAYFSYTTHQANGSSTPFGVNVYNKDTVKQQVQAVRSVADFVIVSMCWGKEDSGDVQPEQEQIAQELADAGVDIVFGHCTHFVQPVKKYKATDGSRETTVYQSLGNTLNSQLPIEALVGGIGVVDIDLATKKVTSFGFLPTYMHYEWSAAEKAAKTLNARHNLKLYPLDKADAPLAASQNGTTVAAQTARLTEILNRNTPVKIMTSAEF